MHSVTVEHMHLLAGLYCASLSVYLIHLRNPAIGKSCTNLVQS